MSTSNTRFFGGFGSLPLSNIPKRGIDDEKVPTTPNELNRKRDNDTTASENKKRKISIGSPKQGDYDDDDDDDDNIDRCNTQYSEYTTGGSRVPKTSTHADIVHGNIIVDELCSRIIDTPEFKRLTRLNQLGVCFEVFRCANHNRFVHSLGVMHLADKVVTRLKQNQPELNINDRDVLCVKVAALCHDLGHGPYSHVFDGVIIPRKYEDDPKWKNWKHEDQSVHLLQYLLEVNKIKLSNYGLNELDETFIYEIIRGDDKNRIGRSPDKYYLYDIVNNTTSGLDVDKLDYFQRDMQHTNVQFQSKKSFERFIESGKVMRAAPIDPKGLGNMYKAEDIKETWPVMMCYPQKMVNDALEFFQTRFKMHNTVYTHKVVKAIEYMYTDAILLADPHIIIRGKKNEEHPEGNYKITECIMDPEAYSRLDDNIITLIKMSTLNEPDIKKANAILDRIAKRELYKCVGKVKFERIVTDSNTKDIFNMKEKEIKREILQQTPIVKSDTNFKDNALNNMYPEISNDTYSHLGFSSIQGPILNTELTDDDFIVEKWHTHHGQKQINPVSKLRFFVPSSKSGKQEVGVHLTEDKYDNCIPPRSFEMFAVRVFVKDREKIDIVRSKFSAWCKDKRNHSPTQYLSSQPYFEQSDDEIERLANKDEEDEDKEKFNLELDN